MTKSNMDKTANLKKQNDELGYMFLPTEVKMFVYWQSSVKPAVTSNQKSAVLWLCMAWTNSPPPPIHSTSISPQNYKG